MDKPLLEVDITKKKKKKTHLSFGAQKGLLFKIEECVYGKILS